MIYHFILLALSTNLHHVLLMGEKLVIPYQYFGFFLQNVIALSLSSWVTHTSTMIYNFILLALSTNLHHVSFGSEKLIITTTKNGFFLMLLQHF